MKLFYSVFSGTIYEVLEREIPNLDEGQIPLLKRPSSSCKVCYGRGWSTHDKEKGIWNVCKCMRKCVDPTYKAQQIRILPKLD
jgi:hypothetical protein